MTKNIGSVPASLVRSFFFPEQSIKGESLSIVPIQHESKLQIQRGFFLFFFSKGLLLDLCCQNNGTLKEILFREEREKRV